MSDRKVTAHAQGDKLIVNYYCDLEPSLEFAKAARREEAETRTAFGRRGDMHHLMRIEGDVILAVCNRLGIPFSKVFDSEYSGRIWEELKKPEFAAFRTTNDKNI